ncbi:putative cyclic nucleotide-binding domain, rmlC-like jelly roll [Helianthus annuus]|nr:putative cyclic nucleotide-binding domain, rmlC-like jelly roll [Helianthus annuus]
MTSKVKGFNLAGLTSKVKGLNVHVFSQHKLYEDSRSFGQFGPLKGSYSQNSYIVREGDPVDEMLFIMRGDLLTVTTNGGRRGFFNSSNLKAGDFCGDELLTWALDPNLSSTLPLSTTTVRVITDVEAFSLKANDLKIVAYQFRRLHSKRFQHTFR